MDMQHKASILIVDDDEGSRKSLALILGEKGYDVEMAETGREAIEKNQKRSFDVALLDVRLPDVGGIELLTLLRETHPNTMVIMVTAYASVETTLRALNEGASAYIIKPLDVNEVLARVREALEKQHLVAENRRLYQEAREQAQQVQQIIDTMPSGIALLDTDLRIQMLNPVGRGYLEALAGARQGEVLTRLGGLPLAELLSPAAVGVWHTLEVEGPPSQVFELTAWPVGGETERGDWVLVLRDVTVERQIEQQTRQQDRLAAIGKLAGGVAHDFNNLLTTIQGFSELALEALASDDPRDWPPGPQLRADLGEVLQATNRAGGLTLQLLAFSRRQVLQLRVLDLNALIADLEKMLRRLLGEDIELVTFPAPELGQVKADRGQIDQVVINLAVNARDAMPNGGRLTLETADVELDEAYAQGHLGEKPGPYVMLAVSDTGVGMSGEVKAHVFEPFFTTKEQGTGLGLATVYGIVKQSGGYIDVYSEPGVGTTLKVYLPQVGREVEAAAHRRLSRPPARGTETILVAEDDGAVRALICRTLREYGYTVLDAGHPEDALRLAGEQTGRIHLLLTDVVMPGISGRALAERLLPSRPETAVLYVSGYTDHAVVQHGVLAAGTSFLQKPFTPVTLARKVREVLDASLPGGLVEQSQADLDVQSPSSRRRDPCGAGIGGRRGGLADPRITDRTAGGPGGGDQCRH
ncbi:MAG: response regulator [Anaerolineae bacterium]|nr:response regulator [Anaerolineae bacterium]